MRTAAKVATEKAEHPERFCPSKKCLWRVTHLNRPNTPCLRHMKHVTPPVAVNTTTEGSIS